MSDTQEKSLKEAAQKRRNRTPLNGRRTLLEVRGKEPGFHYAIINEDSVYAALEGGYEHVRHPVTVGTKRIDVTAMKTESYVVVPVGGGKMGFLMRIPQDLRDEDIAMEQQLADEQMQARVGDFNSNGLSGDVRAAVSLGKK